MTYSNSTVVESILSLFGKLNFIFRAHSLNQSGRYMSFIVSQTLKRVNTVKKFG